MARQLRVLCIGAHPDDCDLYCGGMALKYRELGHQVKFIATTNGDAGHHEIGGVELARRRYAEAQASAQVADLEYQILDNHDGELQPDLATRKVIIGLIRQFKPDLVITHRPNDYHPDHRATAVLVQDAIFLVTAPNILPLTPNLADAPVLGYTYDRFTEPTPFVPTIAIDTDDVFERKVDMMHCHQSQVYEWLARPTEVGDDAKQQLDWVAGSIAPETDEERRVWLAERMHKRFGEIADRYRDCLIKWYGAERGNQIRTAEAIMISEYGRELPPEEMNRYFPFLPD